MSAGQTAIPIAASDFNFQQFGASGTWVSELLPYTSEIVDELCFIKSMYTEAINHDPAITYICTGHQLPGRASLGSWLSYGLGTQNENLPTYEKTAGVSGTGAVGNLMRGGEGQDEADNAPD